MSERNRLTAEQVESAVVLLGKAGYGTHYLNLHHRDLTAAGDWSGTVRDWLRSLNGREVRAIIRKLEGEDT
jgi:hypothetical protein